MDALEAIKTRRSIRVYTDEPVSDEHLHAMLAAAMQAPSAGNQQPWHFIVIRKRADLDLLADALPYGKMLHHAPLGIVICADVEHESNRGYWVQDCSAATQNLLLAAHAQGLGAVWLGVYPREQRVVELRHLLGMPEGATPLCVVAVGHPAEVVPPADRFQPDRVHEEKW
jgi:nitroreductase